MFARPLLRAYSVVAGSCLLLACETAGPGTNASSGSAGQANATAGMAGVAVTAGSAGTPAAGGSDAGGNAAAGLGGVAGVGGPSAGTAGSENPSAGTGGAAGSGGTAGAAGAPPIVLDDGLRQRAATGIAPLQALYHTDTGLFDKNDWWTSGNQLEAVIDYTRETKDEQYVGDVENTFVKNEKKKFDQWGFYDDDGCSTKRKR